MAAKGTTQEERDEAAANKAEAAAEKTREVGRDPDDPASKPGNTGNSPTLGGGVKTMPTEEEDEAAKQQAADAAATSDAMLGEGSYRKAAQAESQAIRDGASVLGKEAVVVQADDGTPTTARRGMSLVNHRASATNPDLMANDATAEIPPEPPKPTTGKRKTRGSDDDGSDDDEKAPRVVPMHGTGGGAPGPSG